MIWLALGIMCAAALAPLVLGLRKPDAARGRRDAALALHREQLSELDLERAEGRIGEPEHAAAVLEVQRRLLAAADQADAAPAPSSRSPILVALLLVPAAAIGLYLTGGHPNMPSMPLAAREAGRRPAPSDAALIAELRTDLARLDPKSPQARQGYILLGSAEGSRGDMTGAADAWRHALAAGFDPTLAVETAEAITESVGHPTPESLSLFKRALAEAPADAPWRPMAEKRLAQAQGKDQALGASPPALK